MSPDGVLIARAQFAFTIGYHIPVSDPMQCSTARRCGMRRRHRLPRRSSASGPLYSCRSSSAISVTRIGFPAARRARAADTDAKRGWSLPV
jgi:hypothetical protein